MNSKYIASISLGIMAIGFIGTLFLPENTAIFLIKGGFEAGLVGGIADWFAVTALFRHPLGIPIPHTSLLLKNRSKIVQSLISAMENELLNKQSIESKLRKLNILQLATSFVTKLLGKKKIRRSMLDLVLDVLRRISLEGVVPYIQTALTAYIRNIDMKSSADTILSHTIQAGYDEKALDYVLVEASKWASKTETQHMLGKLANEKLAEVKMGGLMGFAFQAFVGFMDAEKLGSLLNNLISSSIRDLQDKDNVYRADLLREIRVQLFQWADDETKLSQAQEWLSNLVTGEQSRSFLLNQLEQVRSLVLNKLEQERDRGGRAVFAVYRSIVRHLNEDPAKIIVWENQLLSYIIQVVESNHFRIGKLVKENLDQMDDASLVNMLEEKVGKDLQWIRVNGALCGFVVGVILSLIQL
ncbi:MAG: hypothetical protein K0R67_2495 [Paenibacillus sp.]|nr:hypothetical protein [Paenibacillus sp.]